MEFRKNFTDISKSQIRMIQKTIDNSSLAKKNNELDPQITMIQRHEAQTS